MGVGIRSNGSADPFELLSKPFAFNVKPFEQTVYYPFAIRFFAHSNAKALRYVFPEGVTYVGYVDPCRNVLLFLES